MRLDGLLWCLIGATSAFTSAARILQKRAVPLYLVDPSDASSTQGIKTTIVVHTKFRTTTSTSTVIIKASTPSKTCLSISTSTIIPDSKVSPASTSSNSSIPSSSVSSTPTTGPSSRTDSDNTIVPAPTGTGSVMEEEFHVKGITYSPYNNKGLCKPKWHVSADIAKLRTYEIIRLYDTDCHCIENVMSALSPHQKVFLGIYYIEKIAESIAIIKDALAGDFSKVYAISVGNEIVNNGEAATATVEKTLSSARSQLSAIGYTGPLVSVDTLVAVLNHPELCNYSDFIAVNSHPYWDGKVAPNNCGPWLKKQVQYLADHCNVKKNILVTETGWPSAGVPFVENIPSKDNQDICLKSIIETMRDQVLLFTMYNDYWKPPGPYGVEQFWGIFGDDSNY
ncbi:HFL054Wp [Eremothecium sinecaudum]|uniref:HFL054Wp n=1 Tax=Eremothecium sinecaudum TaxID=45286 RepID=A0A0X8HUK1_9SACH|nr:HFL054Wp [Eremothecium sinecaudum]AMD21802.1 HFL054Wp [Eremothecium sinecaudum]